MHQPCTSLASALYQPFQTPLSLPEGLMKLRLDQEVFARGCGICCMTVAVSFCARDNCWREIS